MAYAAVRKIDAGIGCNFRIVFDSRSKASKFLPRPLIVSIGLYAKNVAYFACEEISALL